MANPKPGVVLVGKLDEVRWDGDEVTAMDDLFDSLEKDPEYGGGFNDDATIGDQAGLRHVTHQNGWTVFFRADNPLPALYVYAVGRHKGSSLKQYDLHTFETGVKTKLYTFRTSR